MTSSSAWPARLPTCITGHARSWPLHDAASTRLTEQGAQSLLAPHLLMERAGLAVARLAMALEPHAQHIRIWVGPGNNGGDGLVAARHLQLAGRTVSVQLIGDQTRRPSDAQAAFEAARAAGVPVQPGLPDSAARCDLQIDGLLGLGASRAASGPMAAAIDAINRDRACVLAIDLPSGLNADTGQLLGEQAVIADHTLTLLTLKPGNHTGMGRDHAGIVWLDTLGADAAVPTARLSAGFESPLRLNNTHKGSYGDVAVVGGDQGMVGAAWLAARAALVAGAGRVICSPLARDTSLVDTARHELMSRPAWWLSPVSDLARTTVVAGCGGGEGIASALPALLREVQRLVLDADALNAIAADAALRELLTHRARRGAQTACTPHPLEAARLLNVDTTAIQADRLHAATVLAERFQATVVLKGSGTVITSPDQLPWINASGNAALATAGTGDVLAGLLGGLWAQQNDAPLHETAAHAIYLHGAAADAWTASAHRGPLRASDLIEALAKR